MMLGTRDTTVNKIKKVPVFPKRSLYREKKAINKHTNMMILDREML